MVRRKVIESTRAGISERESPNFLINIRHIIQYILLSTLHNQPDPWSLSNFASEMVSYQAFI